MQTVFFKTDQGREALTSRPAGLGPRLRSLLIMVDGKRNLSELGKMLGNEQTAAELMGQLAAQGWVDANGVVDLTEAAASVPSAASAEEPPAPAALAVDALPFVEARRLVVRFINDQLGPMGETLAMRVEACKNAADLAAQVPRIRDGLRNVKNAGTAALFDQDVVPRLPVA